jgi:hypothetical protein
MSILALPEPDPTVKVAIRFFLLGKLVDHHGGYARRGDSRPKTLPVRAFTPFSGSLAPVRSRAKFENAPAKSLLLSRTIGRPLFIAWSAVR